jgi:hypothetical protein
MDLVKKFISRRLVVLATVFVAPVVYQGMGISEGVTLAVIGIAGTYIVGRAYTDKKTV